MADSKLLKEAIADAKAVKETAIQNAKIALEEAFTPKLQSIISQKLQNEMEGEDEYDMDEMDYDDDMEDMDENQTSSNIGKGKGKADSGTDNKQPSGTATKPHTELDPETDKESEAVGHETEYSKVADIDEAEVPDPYDAEYETPEEEMDIDVYETMDYDDDMDEMDYDEDEDDMDLESVIRELEADLYSEEEDYDDDGHEEVPTDVADTLDDLEDDFEDDEEEIEIDIDELMGEMDSEDDMDEMDDEEMDEFDLDEILREMGYDDEDDMDEMEDEDETEELEAALEAAYDTIRELKSTINEVNLLNAKLLYTNKIFRGYELNNEQKSKVIESLDRTGTVREVKLVYATIAESMKFGGKVNKKKVKSITEGMASKPAGKSTAPKKNKNIIAEGNQLADRFKQLAGINKENN